MNKLIKFISSLLVLLMLFVSINNIVFASVSDLNKPKISITFDDGYESTYTNALPVLSSKGIKGTVYITTDFIGQPGYMTWDQVASLQNDYGWEIGSHTVTHAELPETSLDKIIYEITKSLEILTSMGLIITNFASPYGAYDNNVLSEVAKYYNSHRGFWDRQDLNSWPYNNSVLMDKSVERSTTNDEVYSYIDQAISENKWLILTLHDVQESPDPDDDYVTKTSDLEEIANYILSSGVEVVTVEESLSKPDSIVNTNPSFEDGFTSWSTDNTRNVYIDTGNNGSYPLPYSSIIMKGNRRSVHLFTSQINANPTSTYMIKLFSNTKSLRRGELGYYIDEYNTGGNWISGKWLGQSLNTNVSYFSAFYEPSSDNVDKFSLQIYLTARSRGTAYLDNIEVYNLSEDLPIETPTPSPAPTETPTPTPTPTVEPTPTPTVEPTPTPSPSITPVPTSSPTPTPSSNNLVQNTGFEELDDGGWALNWTRQTQGFSVNTNSLGNDGENSIELSGSERTHLFSDLILVDPSKSYLWSQYIKVLDLGSEFGFYIDEYDANGNWISGQWKGMVDEGEVGIISFSYTPTSNWVDKIGLQYYYVGGAPSMLYLDSVKLTY